MSENGKHPHDTPAPSGEPDSRGRSDDVEVLEEFSVINEFAVAWVRKIRTRNGERLEVHSPRFGYTLRLDAVTLEALSWQSPETTSKFLTAPLGPEGGQAI